MVETSESKHESKYEKLWDGVDAGTRKAWEDE
jgi:hypothetical protein